MPAAEVRSRSADLPLVAMFAGFALCGLSTVLLGPLLPAMTERWGLADADAGLLFAAQFISSTLTAIVTPWRVRHSLVAGYGFMAAGLMLLTFANYAAAIAAFTLIGMGVGFSVTATNLLVGSLDTTRRGRMLTQSNFCWGVGAVACAPLVGLAERQHQMQIFLIVSAAALASSGIVLLPLLRRQSSKAHEGNDCSAKTPAKTASSAGIVVFLLFAVSLFLYVGAESSISGWISEYSHRFLDMSPPRASLMALVFWLSLVASRAISSALLRWLQENTVLLPTTVIALCGTLLLLSRQNSIMVTVAVALAGLGCGPIFPLLMSRLFAHTGTSRHHGWVFAVSGSGGAVLPWLTGLLSTRTGSLRAAFIMPLAALGGILLFLLFGRRLSASRITWFAKSVN